MSTPMHSTDDELQAWLDEGTERLAKEAADRKVWERQNPMPSWEVVKFNFKRDLYRKAIGA